MMIDNFYKEELKHRIKEYPEENFKNFSKEEILSNDDLLSHAAMMFQKNHQEYNTDYDWAMADAMEEILGIYVPDYKNMSFSVETLYEPNPYEVKTPYGTLTIELKNADYPGLYVLLKQNEDGPKLSQDEIVLAMVEYDPNEEKLQTVVYENGAVEEPSHIIKHKNLVHKELETLNDYQQSGLYSKEQLNAIERAFEADLDKAAIKLIANPEFNYYQMWEVFRGFKQNLSMKEIEIYAKTDFDAEQMECIRKSIKKGYSDKQIALLASGDFNAEQMAAIIYGFDHNVKLSRIEQYARPEFDGDQLELIFAGMVKGLLNEEIDVLANKDFRYLQMTEIMNGFLSNLSIEQVKLYANPELHYNQMEFLRKRIMDDRFPDEFINLIANPAFDRDIMRVLTDAYNHNLSMDEIKLLTKLQLEHGYNENYLNELRLAVENGCGKDEIAYLANELKNASQVQQVRLAFKKGVTLDEVRQSLNPGKSSAEFKRMIEQVIDEKKSHPSIDKLISDANCRRESSEMGKNSNKRDDLIR